MNPDSGYAARVVFAPVPPDLQRILLRYSRSLLEHALASEDKQSSVQRTGGVYANGKPVAPVGFEVLSAPLGAFVTLRKRGGLRGCIGSITTRDPLVKSIHRRTLDAAFHDHRFAPVQPAELPAISIEHSILSEPEEISEVCQIEIGRHGVILVAGNARSVFLPEVPVQQRWDTSELLSALAEKAGLERGTWRDPRTCLQVFTTQHYREDG